MILPFYFTYAMRLQQQRRLRDGRRSPGRHSLSLFLSDPIGFVVSVSISATTAAVTPIATVELIQSPARAE